MEFVPLVVMTATVKKIVDLLKYGTNNDLNALITQLVAWAAGVLVVAITAASDWGSTFAIGEFRLSDMNVWSQLLAGVQLASTAGFGWDVLKAVDGTNSAIVPRLLHRDKSSSNGS